MKNKKILLLYNIIYYIVLLTTITKQTQYSTVAFKCHILRLFRFGPIFFIKFRSLSLNKATSYHSLVLPSEMIHS